MESVEMLYYSILKCIFLSYRLIYAVKQNKNSNTLSSSQMNWVVSMSISFLHTDFGELEIPREFVLLNDNGFCTEALETFHYFLCTSLSFFFL